MYAMIVADNCPRCNLNKKILESKGLLDKIKLVHISTQEGIDLARKCKVQSAGTDIIDTLTYTAVPVSKFIESQVVNHA